MILKAIWKKPDSVRVNLKHSILKARINSVGDHPDIGHCSISGCRQTVYSIVDNKNIRIFWKFDISRNNFIIKIIWFLPANDFISIVSVSQVFGDLFFLKKMTKSNSFYWWLKLKFTVFWSFSISTARKLEKGKRLGTVRGWSDEISAWDHKLKSATPDTLDPRRAPHI